MLNKTISVINAALESLKLPIPFPDISFPDIPTFKLKEKLRWTADLSNAVELIYALFHCKCVNNGNVTIKQLAETFEKVFNIKLTHISLLYAQIRGRVGERTKFLQRLTRGLEEVMQEKDK